MSLPDREKEFILNEIGSLTKERYAGTFRVKCILSQREQFLADLNRRTILGPNPENATVPVVENAFALGQLAVRIVKAPKWWNPSEEEVGGLDMVDENIVSKIFEEATKAEIEWAKSLDDKAENSKKSVKKTASKKNPVIPDEEGPA